MKSLLKIQSIITTSEKKTEFKRNSVKTAYDGNETLNFLGPGKLCQTTLTKVVALANLN